MKNTAGKKVEQIIREEFDSRMAMAVVTYILDEGFEKLQKATEEDILDVKGDAFMTDRFCQALVRAAVRICKECHQINEFLPFIVNHLYVPNAKMHKIEIVEVGENFSAIKIVDKDLLKWSIQKIDRSSVRLVNSYKKDAIPRSSMDHKEMDEYFLSKYQMKVSFKFEKLYRFERH